MTDMGTIDEALEETNKWWKEKAGFRVKYNSREIYPDIKKFLGTRQIVALTGLRRTGKTTLMLKIVEDSLSSGLKPENVVYFSFDDFRDVRIKKVIESYARLMGKNLDDGNFLFLFDEVQKVEGWEEQIKRVYDNRANFKIIVSGSESLFIRERTRESLAGRFFEFKINPLSFNEFLYFRGVKIEMKNLYKEELIREFNRYLLCNGFPEIIDSDSEIIEKYIKENIIEKIVYKDIPQIFAIRDVGVLENVFKIIASDPGEIIDLNSLANDLSVSRQTVSAYLNYLEKSFLIKKLYNFSRNVRKTERKLKKYYPTIILPELIEKGEWGKVLETAVVLQLRADFFWRDVYKNEVDIVKVNKEIVPIEVKYSGRLELRSLLLFMRKFNAGKGLVVSFDSESRVEKNGKLIEVVPAYKFLMS